MTSYKNKTTLKTFLQFIIAMLICGIVLVTVMFLSGCNNPTRDWESQPVTTIDNGFFILASENFSEAVDNIVNHYRLFFNPYQSVFELRRELDDKINSVHGAEGFYRFSRNARNNQAVWHSLRQFFLRNAQIPFLTSTALLIQNGYLYISQANIWSVTRETLRLPLEQEDGIYNFSLEVWENLGGHIRIENYNLVLSVDWTDYELVYTLLLEDIQQHRTVTVPTNIRIQSLYSAWMGDAFIQKQELLWEGNTPFYRVYIDDLFVAWTLNNVKICVRSLNIPLCISGSFDIRIRGANLNNNIGLIVSDFSNFSLSARASNAPTNLQRAGSGISWVGVNTATAYRIYLKNSGSDNFELVYQTRSATASIFSIDRFNLFAGSNMIRMMSVGGYIRENIFFTNSPFIYLEIDLVEEQLPMPTDFNISSTFGAGFELRWDWSNNQSYIRAYHRRAGNNHFEAIQDVGPNFIRLSALNLNIGTNTIRVKRVGGRIIVNMLFSDSDYSYFSFEVTYGEQLNTPQNISITPETPASIYWDKVDNAYGYRVYFKTPEDNDFVFFWNPSFENISSFWFEPFTEGRHIIRVQAIGGATQFYNNILYITQSSKSGYFELDFFRKYVRIRPVSELNVRVINGLRIEWDNDYKSVAGTIAWVRREDQNFSDDWWLISGGQEVGLGGINWSNNVYVIRIMIGGSSGRYVFDGNTFTTYLDSEYTDIYLQFNNGIVVGWWVE